MTSRGTEKLLLSVPEAAEALGVSRSHLYSLIQQGRLPTIRLGCSVRIPKAWLERYIEERVEEWQAARNEPR